MLPSGTGTNMVIIAACTTMTARIGPGSFCGAIRSFPASLGHQQRVSCCAEHRRSTLLPSKRNWFTPSVGVCDFADRCRYSACRFSVFWRGDCQAGILPVEAVPADRASPANVFDLLSVPHQITILRSRDGEHVLICDGPHSLRLDVVSGSLLKGPVQLAYCLSGFSGVDAKVATLRRFLALERLGRLPSTLFSANRKANRWSMILQAHDGLQAGASQREIATALFGKERVDADWEAGYLRTRIQRLVRSADKMIRGGGYRMLLQ